MELEFKSTTDMIDGHSLGIFTKLTRQYCIGGCVAGGDGLCRHFSERLWAQYHHWTEDRLGIEKPCTLGACSWAPSGRKLNCAVGQKIYEQQTVKHERSLEAQKEKLERGAKRNCTEGLSGDFVYHVSSKKQKSAEGRFSAKRCAYFLKLLRDN